MLVAKGNKMNIHDLMNWLAGGLQFVVAGYALRLNRVFGPVRVDKACKSRGLRKEQPADEVVIIRYVPRSRA